MGFQELKRRGRIHLARNDADEISLDVYEVVKILGTIPKFSDFHHAGKRKDGILAPMELDSYRHVLGQETRVGCERSVARHVSGLLHAELAARFHVELSVFGHAHVHLRRFRVTAHRPVYFMKSG